MQDILEMMLDAFTDSMKLLPFLFLTYAVMEYLEHGMGRKTEEAVGRAGRFGPVLGAVCGIFPQCGFSAAASSLFAGGMITMGTLLSVFLSASDEMLPILLSEQVDIGVILKLLGIKAVIGMAAGFLVDLVIRRRKEVRGYSKTGREGMMHTDSRRMCMRERHCCRKGIFRHAVQHTSQVFCSFFYSPWF